MKLALLLLPLLLAPSLVFADWQSYLQNQVSGIANSTVQNANIPPNPFNANPQKVQNVTNSGIQVGFDLLRVFSDTHNFIMAVVDLFTNAYNIPVVIVWGISWAVTAIFAIHFLKKTGKTIIVGVVVIIGIILLLIALGFVHH